MKPLAHVCLWFLRIDLMIARSTGRNPDNIAAISAAIDEWEMVLWREEWKVRS